VGLAGTVGTWAQCPAFYTAKAGLLQEKYRKPPSVREKPEFSPAMRGLELRGGVTRQAEDGSARKYVPAAQEDGSREMRHGNNDCPVIRGGIPIDNKGINFFTEKFCRPKKAG